MRTSYIQHPITHELIPADEYYANVELNSGPMIIGDIIPFRSLATSDTPIISSRSKLREYCKRHDLVPEQECKGLPKRSTNEPYKRDKVGVTQALLRAYDKVTRG